MNKNSLKNIGIMGALASLFGILNPLAALDRLIGPKRKARQHPGSYVGCKKNKFAHVSRQQVRHKARIAIMKEMREKFRLPRRVLRAIVRTRVNREWTRFHPTRKWFNGLPEIDEIAHEGKAVCA